MGELLISAEAHTLRIRDARRAFFDRGECPADLLNRTVLSSWERCRDLGLGAETGTGDLVGRSALDEQRERNRLVLGHAQPIIEHVYEQIRGSGSMVILADSSGLLLQCVGDADFLNRAEKVALMPGASWDETLRGTNAIGTALVEERAVEVFGPEHFFDRNGFLTCHAAPLRDSQGRVVGVLDISGHYSLYQSHTLGLVRVSAQLIEKRLFEAEHRRMILVAFHPRADYLDSLGEGLLAVSADGRVAAVNEIGLELLGLRRPEVVGRDFSMVFETPLGRLCDRARLEPRAAGTLEASNGRQFRVSLRGELPPPQSIGRMVVDAPARRLPPGRAADGACCAGLTLESIATGDAMLQKAIDSARRVLGRNIPILIQGESGAGKELFAKAFHNSGSRRDGPFIALNCASIPETLIESELFGYQGGAFTGARKEGAIGKLQQAHGGTLFLDEIGDMPLNLQARLLRVLQERSVTPLGSTKAIAVDISLICATHRRLKAEVQRGAFREDLYYRLAGLSLTVPALRERTDLDALVRIIIRSELGHETDVVVSEEAMRLFRQYPWPGNIRQLSNIIRVAIALLEEGENVIGVGHLAEELTEAHAASDAVAGEARGSAPAAESGRLDQIEQQAIMRMLEAVGGNISAAARKLGISRNTLYRKIGRM